MWWRVLQVSVSEADVNKTKSIPIQVMKACGGVEVQLYSFLTSLLDGECLASWYFGFYHEYEPLLLVD
jgi:hypothetical protein